MKIQLITIIITISVLILNYPVMPEAIAIQSESSPYYNSQDKSVKSGLYWKEMGFEGIYFKDLDNADSLTFINIHEWPFLLVMNENDKQNYRRIDAFNKRKKYIKNYIREINKNPLFIVNYWFHEYTRRLAYAEVNFRLTPPPFYDARAIYCIKYGIPQLRQTDPGGLKDLSILNVFEEEDEDISNFYEIINNGLPVHKGFRVLPNETWVYYSDNDENAIHFVKDNAWRKTSILSNVLTDRSPVNSIWQWMDLVKQRRSISIKYTMVSEYIRGFENDLITAARNFSSRIRNVLKNHDPYKEILREKQRIDNEERLFTASLEPNIEKRYKKLNHIDFEVDLLQFKGENGNNRLETVVFIPCRKFFLRYAERRLMDEITLELSQMTRDSSFVSNVKESKQNTYDMSLLQKQELEYAITGMSQDAAPKTLDLSVQVKDNFTLTYGFKKIPVILRDFSNGELTISDILFCMPADSIKYHSTIPVISANDIRVMPYPFRGINTKIPVMLYFEIYNLIDSGIRDSYNIQISINQTEKPLRAENPDQNASIDRQEMKLSFNYKRQVDRNDARELIALDFSDIEKGKYLLSISVIDIENESINTEIIKKITVLK